jgi:hypothetical protein
MNAINVIKPYKWEGMWVFDDDRVGLVKEPFVAGIPEMIESILTIKKIDGENGFLLLFSDGLFKGAELTIEWVRFEYNGDIYRIAEVFGMKVVSIQNMEGWLCPALRLYYPEAPAKIYLQVKSVENIEELRNL